MGLEDRRAMVDKSYSHLSIAGQCRALTIHRSGMYYSPREASAANLTLMRLLDELYFKVPFYGIRRITKLLQSQGYAVNGKRIQRLMGLMGWQTLYQKRNTSKRNKQHAVYPYLLKGLTIDRVNQVWAIDITYIPMRKGFMYLFAIIDLHSRYVVNWGISNTMTAAWCSDIIQEAITIHGAPDIINSDQGSQFTSTEHVALLKANNIQISMDGKGRAIDNIFIERLWKSVKYECVYLHVFEDGVKLYEGLQKYFYFYNHERMHQSLKYKTPQAVYKMAA
jgi:putative transposase